MGVEHKKSTIDKNIEELLTILNSCLLYTSDAADDMQCVDLGGRRIIKKMQCWRSYADDARRV